MFRKIVFWLHLILGIAAGLAVAVMSFTGAALAFEKEIIAWSERDARVAHPPEAGAPRLAIDELLRRARAAQPDQRIANIAVSDGADAAVALGTPRNVTLYVNPWTAEVREGQSPSTRAFMQTMRSWHTRLNFAPGPGNKGAAINAAANVIFVLLILAGLILWWPSAWNWRILRPSVWFTRARGRARDWNWHNVIGLWAMPALFVMAVSGVVLSYRWANELVFRLAGEKPPGQIAPIQAAGTAAAARTVPAAAASAGGSPGLSPGALIAATQRQFPDWEQITLRFSPPLGAPSANAAPAKNASLVVRVHRQWPPFSATTITLDAATGELKRADRFADQSAGLRARRWMRVLHTGEAFGWPGELIAGLGCLGACVLVYTGFALSWRRFFGRRESA